MAASFKDNPFSNEQRSGLNLSPNPSCRGNFQLVSDLYVAIDLTTYKGIFSNDICLNLAFLSHHYASSTFYFTFYGTFNANAFIGC